MKSRILIASLLIVSVAYGATVITYNIPNDKGAAIIEAFTAQDNSHVTITFRGSQDDSDPNAPDYSAQIDFRTPVRDPNDTNAQYVKKRTALVVNAMVAAHKWRLKQESREAYDLLAPSTDVNAPTDTIE